MGTLYIVSTPIGNLKDITLRAIDVLKSVDLIVCEDSRVSRKLFSEYFVEKPTISVNDFNEQNKIKEIFELLATGKNLALITDAGTPLISDPGYKVVRAAIEAGIRVEAIPGPSAALAALTISGKAPDKFIFVGFLPKKVGKRDELLTALKKSQEIIKTSIIIYESPYRLIKTLELILVVFSDINIVVCRELTKIHEEVRREIVSDSISHFNTIKPKGEIVIIL